MKLENGQRVVDAPAPRAGDDKPLSASVCHAFAFLGFLGATAWTILGVGHFTDEPAFWIALACAVGGVVWWVIGDIVVNTARRK